MTDVETVVQRYYGDRPVLQRISDALRAAGVDPERPSHRDLWPFDQLHSRGIVATREHAERAGIQAGMHVLDLGCGLGGASRYLAAECGCRMAAIDLTPNFVEAARILTARCGLAVRIEFRQANALALPFEDSSFDHVWSYAVTMNIADKEGLGREVARVLKPGGRFSCNEIARGSGGGPVFPLLWADNEVSSFLVSPAEMRAALEAGGLSVLEQADLTTTRLGETGRQPVIERDDFALRLHNLQGCLADGRLAAQFIASSLSGVGGARVGWAVRREPGSAGMELHHTSARR
ncbi:MAG TPA: methyltransferase domain-containing protein [Stellaceae bacterium]|nr:methyltransferase domain-containing protein [Stellaceae bacterium]